VGFDRDGNFVAFDTLNYDFPNFPCETACRATIDPTLLIQDDGILDSDPRAWERERPYSARSDWFGFRCIVTKVLTGFWPWDGTDYRAHSSHELRRPRVRALRGLSIFDPKVRLASQGLVCPPERLPESLYDDLYKAFNERRRRSFPLRLLTESDWVRCSVCGFDFSSSRCPCGG